MDAKPEYYIRAHLKIRARQKLKETEPRISNSKSLLGQMRIRSQEETAKILGITRQRVQQIERLALWKIRQKLKII